MAVRGYFIPVKDSPFTTTLRQVTNAKRSAQLSGFDCDVCGALVEQYDWKCDAAGEGAGPKAHDLLARSCHEHAIPFSALYAQSVVLSSGFLLRYLQVLVRLVCYVHAATWSYVAAAIHVMAAWPLSKVTRP